MRFFWFLRLMELSSYLLSFSKCMYCTLFLIAKTKKSLTEFYFCQGRILSLSAVPPWIHSNYALIGYHHIHDFWRESYVAEYSVWLHLTAPSAVHLTTCFSFGSQPPELSVKALLPLSPLHRFKLLNFIECYHTIFSVSIIISNIFALDIQLFIYYHYFIY